MTNNSFDFYFPASGLGHGQRLGVLVWMDPTDSPVLPPAWREVLDSRRLIWCAPKGAGNQLTVANRARAAIDALNHAVRGREDFIDGERVYIGGFSGGAKVAQFVAMHASDVFRGALCICGAVWFEQLQSGDTVFPPQTVLPGPGALLAAKRRSRFYFITSNGDENELHVELVYTAMIASGVDSFDRVTIERLPGLGHAVPEGTHVFDGAIVALDLPVELNRLKVLRCDSCGCTEQDACEGGCYWVLPDLCSRCARGRLLAAGMERTAGVTVPKLWIETALETLVQANRVGHDYPDHPHGAFLEEATSDLFHEYLRLASCGDVPGINLRQEEPAAGSAEPEQELIKPPPKAAQIWQPGDPL